jgi:transcriptional regulator of acetoin/glycerol metabolism
MTLLHENPERGPIADLHDLVRQRFGQGLAVADLPPEIRSSWLRSIEQGFDPDGEPDVQRVEGAALRELQERHAQVVRMARAEMDRLYHATLGSQFALTLGSPCGVVLHARCEESFKPLARARNIIRVGMNWNERFQATNGLGTAARDRRPVLVHGGEHFFRRYATLTCAAAPIFEPEGDVVGILDASSDSCPRPPHTLALVRMSALTIENSLFREYLRGGLILVFHPHEEYHYTLSAGLIAVDEDGAIAGLNRQARVLLEGLPAQSGARFEELFSEPLETFLHRLQRHERTRLEDRAGATYSASVEPSRVPWRRRLQAPVTAGVRRRAPASAQGPDFVADDPRLRAALARLASATGRGLPILVRGETGTGKELLARYAHRLSGRKGPFVPVNCAALPEGLVEAELYGYADGAFTGARRGGAPGLVNEADGGTLFLDEIGDMPKPMQATLLRLLDDWTVRPVGRATGQRVDVQLITATNRDIEDAVREGQFRRDLLYRLNALEIVLPRLEERSDFAEMVRHLLRDIDPGLAIDDEAVAMLAARAWPGNARELRHALARCVLLLERPRITCADLAEAGCIIADERGATVAGGALRQAAARQIETALAAEGGNVAATARRLGVSRTTVYRYLRTQR